MNILLKFWESMIPTLRKKILELKIAVLIILVSVANVYAARTYSQTAKVTLDMENKTLEQVLTGIEGQSKFCFIYDQREIDIDRFVNIQADNKLIDEILFELFADTDINFSVHNRDIILKRVTHENNLNGIATISLAQQKTITGSVSGSDGTPMPGVSVTVKGTTVGTLTDLNGKFEISFPANAQVLVFSFIGMKTQEIEIGDITVFNITMEEELRRLDEVLVIGYGTQTRSRMSTSVSKVDERVLESAPRANVGSALAGSIAGLRVQNNNGNPGSTPTIVMRGGTTWDGGGTPLVLVDGVVSSFYALNSEDIESIEVLKDAAATSIYGARAANGVILVSTKKGKSGEAKVSYSYKFGTNKPRFGYTYLNGEDYIRVNRLAWKDYVELTKRTNFNSYIINPAVGWTAVQDIDNSIYTTMYLNPDNEFLLAEPGWKKMRDPLFGQTIAGYNFDKEWIIFQDNDMSRLPLQTSRVNDHHFSISGGEKKATYALGLGYIDDVGIVKGSEFKSYTGNLNTTYQLTEKIKASSTINFSSTKAFNTYNSNYSTIFQRHIGQPPTSRIYNRDGSTNPGLNIGFGNPLYYEDKIKENNLDQRLRASVELEWKMLKQLSLTLRGSYFNIHANNQSFNKAYYTGGVLIADRNSSGSYSRAQTLMGNAILNYSTTFNNDHNVSAMIGSEYYDYNAFDMSAGTRYSPTDLIPTMNVGAEPRTASSSQTGNRLFSTFGRFNYDYRLKYLVQFNFRYDGSSKLRDKRWGFFPGVSLAWNMHQEDFLNASGISNYISSLKPRISYGVNGNVDAISDFGALGTYSLSPIYQGQRGYYNTALPTLGLKWESSTTLNMGIDVGLFKEKISLDLNYFIRDVRNKVAGYALPAWTGFSSINTNIGTLRNKGFEAEINANIINRPDGLSWDIGLTAYTVKNFVVKLPDNNLPKNRQGGTQIYDPASGKVIWVGGLQEGERVGNDIVLGHIQEYIYKDEEEVAEHANRFDVYHYAELAKTRYPGNVAWRDVDKNDTIDYRDRVVLGRTTPSFMGGITTNIVYKGIGLYIRTDYSVGHMIYNITRVRNLGMVQGSQNFNDEALDAWRPDNTDTDVPRITFTDAFKDHGVRGQEDRVNSRYQEKADFLCIREATLSYDIPDSILRGLLSGVRIYFTGSNLHYFTKYTGDLPESGGTDEGRYPLPRVYTFGLNVNF